MLFRSIGPWAHVSASPVLLTGEDGTLSKEAIAAIKADKGLHRVIIVGGHEAVTDDVLEKLGPDYEYTRLGGADRYETSAGIAEWACERGLSWENVALATGSNFADALAGAATMGDPPMGDYHGPILLVNDVNSPTVKLLQSKASQVAICFVFGGPAAVSDALSDPALYTGRPQQQVIQTVTPAPAPIETPVAPVTTPVVPETPAQPTPTPAPTTNTVPVIGKNYDGEDIPDRDAVVTYAYNSAQNSFHLPSCTHGPLVWNANPANWHEEQTSFTDMLKRHPGVDPCNYCLYVNYS